MFFSIQRPQNWGGPHENIFKRLIYLFCSKRWPPPGGGGGVLSDFTRRGTNYLHTTLLKTYPKSNFSDSKSMFFEFSLPKIGGVLAETFSKGSFTLFFSQKMAPRGGAFYQISPNVALTTCIQLYSKCIRKSNFLDA